MQILLRLAALLASAFASSPELLNPVLVVSIRKGYRVKAATAQASLLFSVPTADSSSTDSSQPLNLSSWSVDGGGGSDGSAVAVRMAGAPSYVNGTDGGVVALPLEFDAADLVDATTAYEAAITVTDASTGRSWEAAASLHVTSMASSAVWLPQRLLTTSGACAAAYGDGADDWNATEQGSILCPCDGRAGGLDVHPLKGSFWDTGSELLADGLSNEERCVALSHAGLAPSPVTTAD